MALYPPTTSPHTSPSSPVTSSLVPPIPVPTHGSKGTFAVLSKAIIPATPIEVLTLIRDTNTWPLWNTFCPACVISPRKTPIPKCGDLETGKEGWLELGSEATIDVHMEGDGLVEGSTRSRTQGLVVTRLEKIGEDGRKAFRIAWKGVGYSHWQLHSERVMEMVEVEGGGTDYVCWETFGGMLGSVVKMMVGAQLVDRFGDYSRDLREHFEKAKKGVET
ncbi:uncharacterized protein LY89DRAFT_685256 [Mollisia scopiformis]|uniref:Coenzyme Q-binding protein COQ10 START domain-containing protein n=1 Tax=Mollisia scopiformis TaxID=149040 RepID=A0A194X7Y7_MOLSC|nr:uncharacterized protein LY89DRAFT_685256 [Mollisia scopiformis]KUJ16224.1 hypothetical protein LY89DRAFT_685256 [Mollisia scopiformis]